MSEPHVSVMPDEVLAALAPLAGALVVDGTFGAGGHSRRMLDAGAAKVIGIDRDPGAIAAAAPLLARYGTRLDLRQGRYGQMEALVTAAGHDRVTCILLDIGVSSMQLDTPERGYSFLHDGPLDGRMGDDGPTVGDLVNTLDEAELADLIYAYGEERKSRRVARAIVEARKERPIATTLELAAICARAVGRSDSGRHPATRTFQALRIAVNDELGELRSGLAAAERLLEAGGRLAVISFHSLEDRIVKQFLRSRSGQRDGMSRHLPPASTDGPAPTFSDVARPVHPSPAELASNPRSRSATLRSATRTLAPAWPQEIAA